MVTENLIAERIAIDSYREIITYLGNDDPTTRRIFEEILAQEEEPRRRHGRHPRRPRLTPEQDPSESRARSAGFSFRLIYPIYRLNREKLTILYEIFDITKIIN